MVFENSEMSYWLESGPEFVERSISRTRSTYATTTGTVDLVRLVDTATSGFSATTRDLSIYGGLFYAYLCLAKAEHSYYPEFPGRITGTSNGQLVCGAVGTTAHVWQAIYEFSSKPSSAGTLAISPQGFNGFYFLYDVIGTGTDFTLLAAGDWLYSANGRPLLAVESISDATHMVVSIAGELGSSAALGYSPAESGWSFQAYRGTLLAENIGAQNRTLAANAVQDVVTRATALLDASGMSGVVVFFLGATSSTDDVNIKSVSLDSQWIAGTE